MWYIIISIQSDLLTYIYLAKNIVPLFNHHLIYRLINISLSLIKISIWKLKIKKTLYFLVSSMYVNL